MNNVRARDDGELMGSTHCELQFRPDHTLVTLVRRFVAELYRRLLGDPVGTSRIALATHELLENTTSPSSKPPSRWGEARAVSEVVAVTGNDFAAAAERDGEILYLWLRGNADYHALDAVEVLLTRAHAETLRLGIADVVVDMSQLEFMNSSCFRNFISWISDIQELEEGARYRVKFLFNPELHWQDRSLHTLRSFAADLVSLAEQR